MKGMILMIALLANTAWATNPPAPDPKPVATATAGAEAGAIAGARADSDANAASTSNATGGNADANATGGNAAADSNANSGGNTLSTSSTYKQVRQAPAGIVTSTNTTTPCAKAQGVNLSGPGAGLGWSRAKIDRDCALIAAADLELYRGNLLASIKLRCATTYYRQILGPDCEALLDTQSRAQVEESSATVRDMALYATKEELDRAFKAAAGK